MFLETILWRYPHSPEQRTILQLRRSVMLSDTSSKKCQNIGKNEAKTDLKMARSLVPSLGDFFAFDHHFDDMHREMNRMHQQMTRDLRHLRTAMNRLTPVMSLSDHVSDLPLKRQLEQIRVPVVTEEDGTRRMKVQVDVSSFKPEEVSVTVKEDQVTIHAKHDERSDTSQVYHEFSRTFTIPEGVDAETLMSSLSRDGVLTITSAPLPAIEAPKEKKLAIEMEN
ncbi:hypothetical protein CHS0354_008172 [Potamilus streckersoni]|uniref:SHSP domain-containing protein n=1 Tax=Potamilus streckersoni TaxID=2493646 RepID=A0AAE0RWD5_9BIVA|nr:hypothetical protein CHS0354_008172 [Potamilus streckersoni]